ncbi:hypothetical protein OG453_22650 [Streptomyces sp. NBC_01381]|uniref:hypothetical protein n=1 Tax=Streptomyces sp. NBC_01381 TaxID=2903845 RepID=UPI00225949BB|nr:hypothetical protein [Streptomyces sp. NBC_01381]MCX4669444.1 hypothetical protein [Streptomyces sp. NBC_01381]
MDVNENPSGGERALDALLADAVRVGDVDPDSQGRAVTAFRSARDAGAHRTRTRRRDDWRPRVRRRALGSLRAAVGAVLASLLLGGVAIASIGTSGQDAPAPPKKTSDRTRPSPAVPSPQPSAPSKAPAPSAEPSTRPGSKAKADDKGKKKGKRSEHPRGSHGRPTDLPPKPSKAHGKH